MDVSGCSATMNKGNIKKGATFDNFMLRKGILMCHLNHNLGKMLSLMDPF